MTEHDDSGPIELRRGVLREPSRRARDHQRQVGSMHAHPFERGHHRGVVFPGLDGAGDEEIPGAQG